MNVTGAIAVTEASQVAEGRRLALWLASSLDFSEERSGRAALVASELASNLHKHARSGELLFRRLRTADGDADGMEILALDKGPGNPGAGPVAARRLFDDWDAGARPGGRRAAGRRGRNLHPRHRNGHRRAPVAEESRAERQPSALRGRRRPRLQDRRSRSAGTTGRGACVIRALDIFVADGLGHGLPAHEAATTATTGLRSRSRAAGRDGSSKTCTRRFARPAEPPWPR